MFQASDSSAKSQQQSKSSQPQQSSTGAAIPAQGDKFVDVQNSQIRRIIAQRLLESKQTVPHYYVKAAAALDEVNGVRESLKSQGIKVSPLLPAVSGQEHGIAGMNQTFIIEIALRISVQSECRAIIGDQFCFCALSST